LRVVSRFDPCGRVNGININIVNLMLGNVFTPRTIGLQAAGLTRVSMRTVSSPMV
jgi:hypothetical protein